jgi:hypothetical protein
MAPRNGLESARFGSHVVVVWGFQSGALPMRAILKPISKPLALTASAFVVLLPVTAMAQQTSPPASPSPQPPNTINSVRTPTDQRSLFEFWTPERMRAAQPTPLPRVEPNPSRN